MVHDLEMTLDRLISIQSRNKNTKVIVSFAKGCIPNQKQIDNNTFVISDIECRNNVTKIYLNND